MAPFPDPIQAVSQRLESFSRVRASDVADWGTEAIAFADLAARAFRGGKRLRARFCLSGWSAIAEREGAVSVPPAVIDAAAALEIFHAAALVHDDIVDNSDTRRGGPSSHRLLERLHRESGWAGDAERFGRSAGILLGDLLVAWSDDLFEEGLEDALPVAAAAARRVYGRMRRDVTVGQFLDVTEEAAFTTAASHEHAERALRVASLKSARYSVEQPLVLGATLAGADDEQRAALSAFGHPVGMAFQLRDDVLGVFGDPAVTGKPAGDDLREGKRTLLIAFARETLSPSQITELDAAIGDTTLDELRVGALQELIVSTDALTRVETLIAEYAAAADHALASATAAGLLAGSAVADLRSLAHAAVSRAA